MSTSLRQGQTQQHEANRLSQSISDWLVGVDHLNLFKTCATCSFLGNDDRTCSKFNAQPPVSVVVAGCDKYRDRASAFAGDTDDDIPF